MIAKLASHNTNLLTYNLDMKGTILLNKDENYRLVEEEEKSRFLRNLLEQMGVPITDVWGDDLSLTVEQRIKVLNILRTYSIRVLDDQDGHMQVYVEGELVGEWNKCTYKLKKDYSELDPKRRLYLEMEVNCWTLFEEEEKQ